MSQMNKIWRSYKLEKTFWWRKIVISFFLLGKRTKNNSRTQI